MSLPIAGLLPSALMVLAVCVFQDDARQADLDKLQGTWVTSSLVNDGQTLVNEENQPPELLAAKLVYQGNKWSIKVEDKTIASGIFKLDSTKSPKQIDILDETGKTNDKTKLGIYRIEGDTYTYCLAPAGKPRPSEFDSKPGSGYSLGVSKREKTHDKYSQQGQWKAISATLAGNPFPQAVTESILLVLKGDQYEVMVGDKPDKGTCEIDATQNPKRMTIKGTEGPNAGKTILAIIDIPSADEMRICYDLGGKQFPAEFKSTAENGFFLVKYSRKK